MTIRAADSTSLISQIRANPISVSPRGQGRTKLETEPWIAQHIVPALVSAALLEYPLELEPNDRPDLILRMPSGAVGIEITEIVPPVYALALAIRNQYYVGAVVDRSLFCWGASFTPQQIHDHFSNQPQCFTGNGWVGDKVEQEWARATESAVVKKLERLNAPGFKLYPRNWLAAYASSPGPALDHEHAAGLVTLQPPATGTHCFEKVLVLSGECLVILDGGTPRVVPVPR